MEQEELIKSAYDFYEKMKNDENGRYRSWEHCYYIFSQARKTGTPDIELLCLHLSFYLASWGMYRGSSFLLQKDYLVHKHAVETILNEKYNCLLGCNVDTLNENLGLLFALSEELKTIYDRIREQVCAEMGRDNPVMPVSDTLITKILLGTLGCVPAYDRFFIEGIKDTKTANSQFNCKSMEKIIKHYKENEKFYEPIREKMVVKECCCYPPMKVVDMVFWNYGYKKRLEQKTESEKQKVTFWHLAKNE